MRAGVWIAYIGVSLLVLLARMPIPTGLWIVLSRLLGIRLPHIILWRPLLLWRLLIRRLLPRRLLPWLLWKLLCGTRRHFTVTVLPCRAALRVPCRGTTDSTARYWSAQVHAGRLRRDPLLVARLVQLLAVDRTSTRVVVPGDRTCTMPSIVICALPSRISPLRIINSAFTAQLFPINRRAVRPRILPVGARRARRVCRTLGVFRPLRPFGTRRTCSTRGTRRFLRGFGLGMPSAASGMTAAFPCTIGRRAWTPSYWPTVAIQQRLTVAPQDDVTFCRPVGSPVPSSWPFSAICHGRYFTYPYSCSARLVSFSK